MSTFLLLVSCKPSNNSGEATSADSIEESSVEKPVTKEVIYEECAVYAAASDYMFKDEAGEIIIVRVSAMPEETPTVVVPSNLLEEGEDLDGPPGANPEVVGKKYVLVYNENGEVVEVKPTT